MACIAADTMTTFGDKKLTAVYSGSAGKILRSGDAWIGMVGSAAHNLVMESLLNAEKFPKIATKLDLFEFARRIHPRLKTDYFLNADDEDDDPYESSQIELLVMNGRGIFGLLALREVYEYTRFWALGSGSEFALGAMYAVYGQELTASEIAEVGVRAGVEFDGNSAEPIQSYTVRVKTQNK